MKKTIILLVVLFANVVFVFSQTAPLQIAPLQIEGLKAEVIVRRDHRSIPYIEAKDQSDLYFAQGYVTASDRMFQMDLMRRLARGQTAEIFGRAGLEEDKRWRKLGFTQICDESYKLLKPDVKNALDSYTRGVNAYIAALAVMPADKMPPEYRILQIKPREWLATDSLVIGKILSDALSNTWRQDLTQSLVNQLPRAKADMLSSKIMDQDVVLVGRDKIAPKMTLTEVTRERISENSSAPVSDEILAQADEILELRRTSLQRVGMYMEDQAASNNWVISGKLIADGKPMLANDPHLQPTAPGIWYMVHLTMTGAAGNRVSGVTLPGAPGVTLGHNEHIAWGATNLGPDVQDLFIENAETLKSATTRTEKISVRKNPLGPATDQQIEELSVLETKNGVVYFEDGDKKYSFKWTARDPKNMELGAFYYLNYAKDWKGFNAALKQYGGATQNFIYADMAGNIGWHNAGAIPIRRKGDGSVPYDAGTTDGDWTGMIPYEELPQLYNPASGFIVTANQRVVGNDHKYFSVLSRDAATPWRARRITNLILQLVNNGRKITMDNVRDIQMDVSNIALSEFVNEVIRLGGASPETLEAMKNWDSRMTYDATTSLIINEMRVVFAEKLAEANLVDKDGKRLGIPASLVRERVALTALETNDKNWLPKTYASYKDLLIDSEKQAELNLNALAGRLKKERKDLVWGDYFVANFMHPLAAAPLIGGQFTVRPPGVNGSGQTPNVGASVSMRFIASPGNWDATRHVIPLGQSGDVSSPHFRDQFESWRTGKTEVFQFSKEAVERSTSVVMTMTPKK